MSRPKAVPETRDQRRERHAREALGFEEETAASVTRAFRKGLVEVAILITRMFLQGNTGAALTRIISQAMTTLKPDMQPALITAVRKGVALGVRQGQEVAQTKARPEVLPDRARDHVLSQVDDQAFNRLIEAKNLAERTLVDDSASLNAVLGKANQAGTEADATSRWLANRAISAGTAATARMVGANLVWVPERDACLHCLAYAGHVVRPGESFPEGLTYADKPLQPFGDLQFPPLHPNCRCQVDLTYLPPGRSEVSLIREAQRSVARGIGMASGPAALRAADRLVNREGQTGLLLPKSVIERARRNVAAGAFKQAPSLRRAPSQPAGTIQVPTLPAPKVLKAAPKLSERDKLAEIAAAADQTETRLTGGQSAVTNLVTLPDGRTAVHKTGLPGFEDEDNVFSMDGEQLASLVADAIGAPLATVYRDGPQSVWVETVGGSTDLDAVKGTKDWILLGLVDAMSGYRDRASGLRNDGGQLRAFDSGGAWLDAVLNPGDPPRPLAEEGAPSADIIDPEGNWRDVPLSRAELVKYRSAVELLRPQFKAAGRLDWLAYSLDVLNALIEVKG